VLGFRLAFVAGIASVLSAGTSASAVSEATTPLVGTWRTDTISQADAEVTLRRYGLSKWVAPFRRQTPFTEPMALILVITPTEWDLYGKPKGKPRVEIDYDAKYAVQRGTVDKIHSSGFTTLGWSVNKRKLTLRWLKTTEPPYMGIPDKVFQYALYMTRKFTRVA
jgi:hypothetical protein